MNYGYYSEVLAFLNDYFMRSVKDSHCLCNLNKIIESSMHESNVLLGLFTKLLLIARKNSMITLYKEKI